MLKYLVLFENESYFFAFIFLEISAIFLMRDMENLQLYGPWQSGMLGS
jgi:hypothetical protein